MYTLAGLHLHILTYIVYVSSIGSDFLLFFFESTEGRQNCSFLVLHRTLLVIFSSNILAYCLCNSLNILETLLEPLFEYYMAHAFSIVRYAK